MKTGKRGRHKATQEQKELAQKYLKNIDVWIEKDYSDKDRFVFIKSK